ILFAFASGALASLSIVGGNLHASASAAGGIQNNPPDVTFALPSVSDSASATNSLLGAGASVSETASFVSGFVDISASGSCFKSSSPGSSAGATASGTLTINEDVSQILTGAVANN